MREFVGTHTNLIVFTGFVLFVLGGSARMYMLIALRGWKGYLTSQKNLTREYRQSFREPRALVPLVLMYTLTPLGIIIVFSAILLS